MAGMLVISADTALTYRNKLVDAKQIGRELGVRYVVEGSLERSGNRVRVNAQLIDAATHTQLWADRSDHEITDLFALQSEITGRIAITLSLELVAAEATAGRAFRRTRLHFSGPRILFWKAAHSREFTERDQLVRAGTPARSAIRRGERPTLQVRW
jgi:hypothetical protein